MDRNRITFFVVDNKSGQTRKIVIPSSWLKGAGLILMLMILATAAGTVDYFGLMMQASENQQLRLENAQLTKQFQVVEGKVSSLENSLEKVKVFTTKLKLMTNIESEDRVIKLSMGASPTPGQQIDEYEPMEQRPPLENLANQDQTFLNKQIPATSKGELISEESDRDYASIVIRIEKAVRETQLKEQSVIELWESLSERQSLLNATPNIRPAKGWLTSKFGYRKHPFIGKMSMHAGVDIAAAPGAPVYAPADGIITFASYDESYGKLVSIDHGYGFSTRFGHNSQIYVHVGQRISKWDVIAAVGNTGRSTGPHLHYEVRINGTPVDPENFILD